MTCCPAWPKQQPPSVAHPAECRRRGWVDVGPGTCTGVASARDRRFRPRRPNSATSANSGPVVDGGVDAHPPGGGSSSLMAPGSPGERHISSLRRPKSHQRCISASMKPMWGEVLTANAAWPQPVVPKLATPASRGAPLGPTKATVGPPESPLHNDGKRWPSPTASRAGPWPVTWVNAQRFRPACPSSSRPKPTISTVSPSTSVASSAADGRRMGATEEMACSNNNRPTSKDSASEKRLLNRPSKAGLAMATMARTAPGGRPGLLPPYQARTSDSRLTLRPGSLRTMQWAAVRTVSGATRVPVQEKLTTPWRSSSRATVAAETSSSQGAPPRTMAWLATPVSVMSVMSTAPW